MTPTQRPTFTQRVIGDGGFVYLLASGGSAPSINFDFTTGILPGAITFTRASTGTYNSSGGILTTAAVNAARFNYVGGVPCLLIEPAATNLLIQSNGFSTSWFAINGGVVVAAQFVSPDGTNDGWSLTSGTGFGGIGLTMTFSAIPYTFSIWVKRITGTSPILLKLNSVGSGDIVTAATIARLVATITPNAATDGAYIVVDAATGSTNGIFGAQVETGGKATSYIPTTTAAATRAADSATFTIPAGTGHLTFTFDDNSTQLVVVSAGSYTIPATLSRPNIKSIVGGA